MSPTRHAGPGKSYRKGITLFQLFDRFPKNRVAEQFLEANYWGTDGAKCPRCNSREHVKEAPNRKPSAYWCGEFRKHFNVRTGTILADSKISYPKFAKFYGELRVDEEREKQLHPTI